MSRSAMNPCPPERGAWYANLLACPACRVRLATSVDEIRCDRCGITRSLRARPLDLTHPDPPQAPLRLPRSHRCDPDLAGVELEAPPIGAAKLAGARDSRTLFSALTARGVTKGDLLDLGCGPGDQALPAARAGFRYVGADLFDARAEIRADAHALPFADGAFDVVLAYAVLEHLHAPHVALDEVRRVLRPGGTFVGTVSQGEPFHASYFHWTAWGVAAIAGSSGFRLDRLWPSRDTLAALGEMGRYSRPVRVALRALDAVERGLPFLAPRRWLRWTPRERRLGALHTAGSLCFLMTLDAKSPD